MLKATHPNPRLSNSRTCITNNHPPDPRHPLQAMRKAMPLPLSTPCPIRRAHQHTLPPTLTLPRSRILTHSSMCTCHQHNSRANKIRVGEAF
jgi:hypothetical protein